MDVSEPEKLERRAFSDPDRMVERPVIEQDNDVDAPFAISVPQGIPQHLQDVIQYQSVDPEVELIEQVNSEITVDADKVAEENPQSRFRILDVAIQKPGTCFVCKDSGGDGRQFVDFNQTIEWYGVVYVCTFCVIEMAKLLGFDGKTSDWVLAESNLQKEISAVDDRWVKSQEEIRALRTLLRDHLNGDCGAHSSIGEIPDAELIEPESDGDSSGSPDGDESDADESDSVEGPDDVSEPSNDDVEPPKPIRRTRKSAG